MFGKHRSSLTQSVIHHRKKNIKQAKLNNRDEGRVLVVYISKPYNQTKTIVEHVLCITTTKPTIHLSLYYTRRPRNKIAEKGTKL